MLRVIVTAILLLIASGTSASGQTSAGDSSYLFFDTPKVGWKASMNSPSKAQIAILRKAVTDAGEKGYVVQLVARFANSLGILLKREGAGTHSYRLVAHTKHTEFVDELNGAASQGFRVVPAATKKFEDYWMAIVEQQPGAARFMYSGVKPDDEVEQTLADARKKGFTIIAAIGSLISFGFNPKPLLILEQANGAAMPAAEMSGGNYRIVATEKTSTLEKEIKQAADEGYRATVAGFMTVVMERASARPAPPVPVDYRVAAMTRVATAEGELQAAGAEGFRVLVVPESTSEGVFVLHRAPGTSDKFQYKIMRLKENTAGGLLKSAEADGYHVIVLLNDLAVLERTAR
jgi:hypothetical protein